MRGSQSFFTLGILLVVLGVLVLLLARPAVGWDRIEIEGFGCEFEYPRIGWTISQGPSTIRDEVVLKIGEEMTAELEASGEFETSKLELGTYAVNLFDTANSSEIHVATRPLTEGDITAVMISQAAEEVHRMTYADYRVLYSGGVRIDQRDGFCRVATYTETCCGRTPQRQIAVVTYVIEKSVLYQIALLEHSWINLPGNLKIYNHILRSFDIH